MIEKNSTAFPRFRSAQITPRTKLQFSRFRHFQLIIFSLIGATSETIVIAKYIDFVEPMRTNKRIVRLVGYL
jgi:hypothetical protein